MAPAPTIFNLGNSRSEASFGAILTTSSADGDSQHCGDTSSIVRF